MDYTLGEDSGVCGDLYDFFLNEGIPEGEIYTCDDTKNYVHAGSECCAPYVLPGK